MEGEGLLPRGISHNLDPVLLQLGSQKCIFVLQFFNLDKGGVERGGEKNQERS